MKMIQPYSKDHIKAVTFPDMPLVSYDFQTATMTRERETEVRIYS